MTQPQNSGQPKRWQQPIVWVVLMVLAVNLLVFILSFVWLRQNKAHYQERATVMSQNIARLLEQSIADSIERADLALQAIRDEIGRQEAAGGIDPAGLKIFIERQHKRLPDLDGIKVIDAVGNIRHGINLTAEASEASAPESYFSRLREARGALGAVISKPAFDPAGKRWTMTIARRVEQADGSFGGVLAGVFDLQYFDLLFASLNVGENGAIGLRGEDMAIVTRYPKHEGNGLVGQLAISPTYQEAIRQRPYKGTFVARSEVDGIERTYSYQKLGKWPLVVQVGLATEDNLAPWHRMVGLSAFFFGLFALLSVFTAAVGYRFWRDRRAYLDAIDAKRRKFRALAEMSSDWFWEQDSEFRFIGVTDDLSRKYGVSGENFEGKTRWEVAVDQAEEKWEAHRAALQAHEPFQDFEYSVRDQDGFVRCISVSGEPVFDDEGRFTGYRGVGKDITDRKRYEEQIEHMAQYDALTGLPNRMLFNDRLLGEIKRAKRYGSEFALLYFDLDKFKPVNDQYGHAAGDHLLRQVAHRVKGLLRESDTVARLGGDEFAALIPRVHCRADAEEVSQRIIRELTEPFLLDNVQHPVSVGVSIGIAIFPHDATHADGLLGKADTAMYKSKQTRNCYHFYGDMVKAGEAPRCAG